MFRTYTGAVLCQAVQEQLADKEPLHWAFVRCHCCCTDSRVALTERKQWIREPKWAVISTSWPYFLHDELHVPRQWSTVPRCLLCSLFWRVQTARGMKKKPTCFKLHFGLRAVVLGPPAFPSLAWDSYENPIKSAFKVKSKIAFEPVTLVMFSDILVFPASKPFFIQKIYCSGFKWMIPTLLLFTFFPCGLVSVLLAHTRTMHRRPCSRLRACHLKF